MSCEKREREGVKQGCAGISRIECRASCVESSMNKKGWHCICALFILSYAFLSLSSLLSPCLSQQRPWMRLACLVIASCLQDVIFTWKFSRNCLAYLTHTLCSLFRLQTLVCDCKKEKMMMRKRTLMSTYDIFLFFVG